jgi:hypothetical protein
MATHSRLGNGRSAWVALCAHPTHTDTNVTSEWERDYRVVGPLKADILVNTVLFFFSCVTHISCIINLREFNTPVRNAST